jgi:hypothetical protein
VTAQRKLQLTPSEGKKKKGNEVEDEDDHDVVRTSLSQERATATLCIEEYCSPALSIYSFPHISER